MTYPTWSQTPACRGTDTEMWFCDDSKTGYKEVRLLERICANCPIKQECLQYALENTVEGYWAGTTPRVRQRLRTRLNIIPKPVGLAWDINTYA